MNIDIDGLIELAKKATPGPWFQHGGICQIINMDCNTVCETYEDDEDCRDASFIAAANPAVILALCERLREAEKTIANALSELKAGDVQSAIDQLEAGNE